MAKPRVGVERRESLSAHLRNSLENVCGRRPGAEKRDQVDYYLMRGRGNIYPTDDYVTEHVMLANRESASSSGEAQMICPVNLLASGQSAQPVAR